MAVTSSGLSFHPLYWRHDDNWNWLVPSINGFDIRHHYGHTHFFMPGYQWSAANQDAFYGEMKFKFELQDIWGPRSQDPNQQSQYRVIGTPKWYFHVQELWRRIYIQQWDDITNDNSNTDFTNKKGIRYDASQAAQTFGPFREGRDYVPYFLQSARTLPIEYFNTPAKQRDARDNFIRQKYKAQPPGATKYPYSDDFYVPPANSTTPIKATPGGVPTYVDGLYIYPTLEYQKVIQLNWERLPGNEAKNDKSPTDFGDGWDIEVTVPFKSPLTNQYRSPFAAQPGVVSPPGFYHNNLVQPADILKFRTRDYAPPLPGQEEGSYDYEHRPFGMSPENSDQPLTFQNPYPERTDGRWVQQCIGGIVHARAEVTIESKLNNAGPDGYEKVWVLTSQLLPADKFAGTDQKIGNKS